MLQDSVATHELCSFFWCSSEAVHDAAVRAQSPASVLSKAFFTEDGDEVFMGSPRVQEER